MDKRRYVFKQDDDAHWYLVPLDELEEFNEWVEAYETTEWDYQKFSSYMIGGPVSLYSFVDPQRD